MDYLKKLIKFNESKYYEKEKLFLFDKVYSVGGNVLDVGCGSGCMLNYFRQRGMVVNGIDTNVELIKYFNSNNVVQGDAMDLPFIDEEFNAVYFMHSLGHFNNPIKPLDEAHRVLKKGGWLYIITPNRVFERLVKPVKKIRELGGNYFMDSTIKTIFSADELESLVNLNFHDVNVRRFGAGGFQRLYCHAIK